MKNRRGFNPDARIKDADFAFRVLSDSVFTKGFLGPSLRENRGLPSVGVSSARRAGVIVDENGKMRCPPGTPNANQFTDINMSNCMIPSAETVARNAAEVAVNAASKAIDGFKRGSVGKKKDRNSIPRASVGFANSDGFLEQRRVLVGNSVTSPRDGSQVQLNSVSDSVKHLADGGDMTDIPDEHLVRAIEQNTGDDKRFRIIGTGGGMHGMTRMRDTNTEAFIGIKYAGGSPGTDAEAMREVAAELVLEHFGYEPTPMRLVPSVQTDDSIGMEMFRGAALITELAHNRHEGTIESARIDERGNKYDYRVPSEDVVRMAILDSILWNSDRHEGNFMIARGENGEGELVPIDHSMGLATSWVIDEPSNATKGIGAFGLEQALAEYYEDGGMERLTAVVAAIQEDLASIDTVKLEEQLRQLFTHAGIMGLSPRDSDKEAILSVLPRITNMANPEWTPEIAEKIAPEYKRPGTRSRFLPPPRRGAVVEESVV